MKHLLKHQFKQLNCEQKQDFFYSCVEKSFYILLAFLFIFLICYFFIGALASIISGTLLVFVVIATLINFLLLSYWICESMREYLLEQEKKKHLEGDKKDFVTLIHKTDEDI